MNVPTPYTDRLLNSPSVLRRFAQHSRLKIAIQLALPFDGKRVLDFGAGDGFFLSRLGSLYTKATALHGFEPFQDRHPKCVCPIYRTWSEVDHVFRSNPADLVTCFEVLEHLAKDAQLEVFEKLLSITHAASEIVFSVPVECGLPSIPKNLLRRAAWKWRASSPDGGWDNLYTLKNILKSVLELPINEHRTGRSYLSHMGFYYRDLEHAMTPYFQIAERRFSPFNIGTHQINSQVFYRLFRRDKETQ